MCIGYWGLDDVAAKPALEDGELIAEWAM